MVKLHIGFISTRLAGTDGVSLESAKWSQVLEEAGHRCFYFAGELDRPAQLGYTVPEAHFKHPLIERINRDLFDDIYRTPVTSETVAALRRRLKQHVRCFVERFGIDLLIVENALSLPMNVPLGLALTEYITETRIPAIAHHHDFYWERPRYALHAAEDYLKAAFPPAMSFIQHVVINSYAAEQVALRTGMRSALIPNVMPFETPPPPPDEITARLRPELGIGADEVLLLQPTRIVPRKRIERAIELARKLERPCCLLITHSSSDEGNAYRRYLAEYAELLGVRVLFAAERFNHRRGTTADGSPVFSLADAYHQADLVTYPSTLEGFGNAFLEAIYYRKPLLMSRYETFKTDIQPKGFQVIAFDDFIDDGIVRAVQELLDHPEKARAMVETNYRLARRHFSFTVLRKRLCPLVSQCCEAGRC